MPAIPAAQGLIQEGTSPSSLTPLQEGIPIVGRELLEWRKVREAINFLPANKKEVQRLNTLFRSSLVYGCERGAAHISVLYLCTPCSKSLCTGRTTTPAHVSQPPNLPRCQPRMPQSDKAALKITYVILEKSFLMWHLREDFCFVSSVF